MGNLFQNGHKSLKIELWSCLGTLWALSRRQDSSRSTTRGKINEESSISGGPMGSKMKLKAIKNLMKICFVFWCDSKVVFSRSWMDFGVKNLSKMRGRRVTLSTRLRIYEKCDFEPPSNGFAIFLTFGTVVFRLESVYFSIVFSNAISRLSFSGF